MTLSDRSSGEFIDVGSRRVHYYRWGEGTPAVVFESGLISPGFVWKPVAEALAPITTVVAYDRPGYGRSDPGTLPRTTQQVAAELVQLIDGLGLGQCVLVGHSFGGPVVEEILASAPGLVAGLVLVDAADAHAFVRHVRAAPKAIRSLRRRMALQSVPALVALGLSRVGLAYTVARRFPPLRLALAPLIDRVPAFWEEVEATAHPRYCRAVISESRSWADSLAAATPEPSRTTAPVAVMTATHFGLSESLVARSWRSPRPRLPSFLLAQRRRAETLSSNWTWEAVDGPHELVVTAPDRISLTTAEVVRCARRGDQLAKPVETILSSEDVARLASKLGSRPIQVINALPSDSNALRLFGTNEALIAALSRRQTRRALVRWSKNMGPCVSAEPSGAVDYDWTRVVTYTSKFGRGANATIDVHLDDQDHISDITVTRLEPSV